MIKKRTHYIKNKDLLLEIKKYIETCRWDENGKYIEGSGIVHEELGRMIITIAKNFSTKPNFSGYTWKNDMVGEAVLTCVKYIHNFKVNTDRPPNPFAYITTICYNSFVNYIKKQKNHSIIKDTLYNNSYKINVMDLSEKGINYELLKKN